MEKYAKEEKRKKFRWLPLFLFVETLLFTVVGKCIYVQPWDEFLEPYGLAIMLLFLLLSSLSLPKWADMTCGWGGFWTGTGYLISLSFLAVSIKYPVYSLWFLGSVLIGALVDGSLGMAFHFIICYLYCGFHGSSLEQFVFYFVIGGLLCLLGKSLQKISMFFYGAMVALSCHVIFLFAIKDFSIRALFQESTLYSLASVFAVLLAVWIVLAASGRKGKREEALYNKILKEDHMLLQRLRDKSKALYAHSQRIGELSGNAAALLGCDEKLCRAGGLYYEIGRISGKDYLKEGIRLLEEYHFPKDVIGVLGQEKPTTKEAAIVMLSESVVSAVAYCEMEKKKALASGEAYKEKPHWKIVENIFELRLKKGSLDDSGLTMPEYRKLKNYYVGIYR